MANLSVETRRKIYEAAQKEPEISNRALASKIGVDKQSAGLYRVSPPESPTPAVELDILDDIKRKLRKGPLSDLDLADALDCSPKRIKDAIEKGMSKGSLFMQTVDGKYDLKPVDISLPGKSEAIGQNEEWTHRFGITTDNHLCNKHARLDVLAAAYQHFENEGITKVYNCGNWVDGEARFNKAELITAPGVDNQLDYMIDKWPVHKNIVTEYIAGDDHEGWYAQRECIEIGRYLQYRAEDQGRFDLKYLGYAEADVKLIHPQGGSAVMRLVHPGGGSSYAISYTDQKRVESYQGGEKPQVELAGHYHKFNVGYPREVHTVQCGCTCDQTLFMRKKKLQAHVGFVVINIKQEPGTGIITRFSTEWFPYYDRKFYEKRFS